MKTFESLVPVLELMEREQERVRFCFLDHFPPAATDSLMTELVAHVGKADWVLLDEIQGGSLRLEWKADQARWVVIDTFHQSNPSTIAQLLKSFLSAFPNGRFIILGNGNLRTLTIPSYYGEGRYLNMETHSLQSAADDFGLLQHSRKIIPQYQVKDLVLGNLTQSKLDEAVSYIQTKEHCEQTWGFRKKHTRGHGVTLLFHGDSGTGKTMAAECVAQALKMPLYQIDLSSVVSKWIGETEKNLKSIFRSAEGVRGILLFDEGDAIFGSRTDTKSAQDKYSNLEVNYLLQEIEAFNGIAILSTNYFKNMDTAFLRRFSYVIQFGAPDEIQRKRIWERNIPDEMPVGATVDFNHLSQFRMTGGNIRNCIRYAAAQAAMKKRKAVEHEDFLWAIKREMQKHDVTLSREQVGETYWKKVSPEWEAQNLRVSQKKSAPAESVRNPDLKH